MPNLMVTGGCGFIGSNFIRHMLRQHPHVHIVNVDKLSYAGNLHNIEDVHHHPHHTFIRADITNRSQVNGCFANRVDAVVHFAAESHVDRSIQDAAPFVHTNVVGTQILLEAAREYAVDRFIHVSTDEVYGSIPVGESAPEDAPLAPTSPYAASKAASDLLVLSYARTYDLPAIVTRCSNNYGPYQFPEKLIPLFVTRLLQNESVPVYGDGNNIRDWLHVDDHCWAIDAVLHHGTVGTIYNIGGGCSLSNLELTQHLVDALEKPSSLIRFVADRPGHDRRYAIDCRKITSELGWRPAIAFDDGLRETIDWYVGNAAWSNRLRNNAHHIADAYLKTKPDSEKQNAPG